MSKKRPFIDQISYSMTKWVGSPASIITHTLAFLSAFGLILIGFDIDRVMLVLTTAVSLEAIYLSLFIQMSVNRSNKKIKDIEEDVEDILEDTEALTEDPEAEIPTE